MDQRDRWAEIQGLAMITFGVQCSVMANTCVKYLAHVPLLQTMQARFALQWLCSMSLTAFFKARGHPIHLTGLPGNRGLLLARACTYTSAIALLWAALRRLPVGEATAIVYLHPILCGVIAWQFLNESLNKVFWAQALVSCIGVAFVSNLYEAMSAPPSIGATGRFTGAILALGACLCFASGNAMIRLLPMVHPLEVQVFTDSFVGLICMPIALLITGTGLDWSEWGYHDVVLILAFTLFGLATSFLSIMGFRLAPASKAALFMYLEVPSSFVVQLLSFGVIPGTNAVVGASLITIAALGRLAYEVYSKGDVPIDMVPSPLGTPMVSPLHSLRSIQDLDDLLSSKADSLSDLDIVSHGKVSIHLKDPLIPL